MLCYGVTMTHDKVVPRRIGRWCFPYLHSRIREASPPFQKVASGIDLSEGYTFVYAPQNVTPGRIRRLDLGGVIQGKWLTPHTMQLNTIPQQLLIRYLRGWLGKKTAPQAPPSRLVLTEAPLWCSGDSAPLDYLHSFIYEEALYLWAWSQDSTSWIESLVREVDLSYPPALIYGFDTPHRLLGDEEVLSVLKDKRGVPFSLKLIVMGVFDGESFLIWRRRTT